MTTIITSNKDYLKQYYQKFLVFSIDIIILYKIFMKMFYVEYCQINLNLLDYQTSKLDGGQVHFIR